MKSATIPPLRVTTELREAAESVLKENEFISRGLAAKKQSEESGSYVAKAESLTALDAILEKYNSSK